MWYDVMWCDVIWYYMIWCDVMWCDVMWYYMMWCDVMWCDVMGCGVMWCDVMWCDVMWCAGAGKRVCGGCAGPAEDKYNGCPGYHKHHRLDMLCAAIKIGCAAMCCYLLKCAIIFCHHLPCAVMCSQVLGQGRTSTRTRGCPEYHQHLKDWAVRVHTSNGQTTQSYVERDVYYAQYNRLYTLLSLFINLLKGSVLQCIPWAKVKV